MTCFAFVIPVLLRACVNKIVDSLLCWVRHGRVAVLGPAQLELLHSIFQATRAHASMNDLKLAQRYFESPSKLLPSSSLPFRRFSSLTVKLQHLCVSVYLRLSTLQQRFQTTTTKTTTTTTTTMTTTTNTNTTTTTTTTTTVDDDGRQRHDDNDSRQRRTTTTTIVDDDDDGRRQQRVSE